MSDLVTPEFIPVNWTAPVPKSAIGTVDMERADGTNGFLGMASPAMNRRVTRWTIRYAD